MKRKKKAKKPLRWLVFVLTVLALLIMGGCTAMMSVGDVLIDEGKVKDQIETSIIYDKNNREVYKLYVEDREYVDFQQIPSIVISAFVNTEDERFFTHGGVDVIAIGRALYRDILAGGAVEGASTITQQLVKNVYLTHEKSIWRKTKEALIALNLERKYSKEQILEFYLNEIYFGDSVYGIKAAAKYYFGKDDLNNLSLAEVATLAGMPKAPNTYSPLNNYEKSLERRKVVLSLMYKNGTISKEQMQAASKEKLDLAKGEGKKEGIRAYVDYVLQEAQDKYGLTENQIYRGGYDIYTEMDSKAQNALIRGFENPKLFPKTKSSDMVQAGMVILDPHSGGVAALMGGREYVKKGLNRALAKRSPGSTFKPLAVYTPALENGWKPYDMLKDEKITYPGGYSPSNWNGDGYWGQVTMYDALKRSKNAPAVWLLNEIGMDTSFRYLDRFGIPYDKNADRKLGIALGDLTNGVSPMDMAKAYSAFANHGVIIEPHTIAKIIDRDGTEQKAEVNASTVMSEQSAFYMTKMLQGVVEEGTGTKAKMNRPVAGKTGTTQMEGTKNGNRDAWFVGYTPEYVAAIWMGFDKSNTKTNYLTEGSAVTAKFFASVMSEALEGRKVQSFSKPKGVKELEPPFEFVPIQDLSAEQLADSIHLKWSASGDNGMIYRIYKYAEDPSAKELIGETEYTEWIDLQIASDQPVSYFVVPYQTELQREGPPSNTVQISPVGIDNPELLPPEGDAEQNDQQLEEVPPLDPGSEPREQKLDNGQQPVELPLSQQQDHLMEAPAVDNGTVVPEEKPSKQGKGVQKLPNG